MRESRDRRRADAELNSRKIPLYGNLSSKLRLTFFPYASLDNKDLFGNLTSGVALTQLNVALHVIVPRSSLSIGMTR